MWVVRRAQDGKSELRGGCATLWEALQDRSFISRFDFDGFIGEIESGLAYLGRKELTQAQLAKAKETLAAIERGREFRLSRSEAALAED